MNALTGRRVRKIRVHPAERSEQLGRDPSKKGSPNLLFLRVFLWREHFGTRPFQSPSLSGIRLYVVRPHFPSPKGHSGNIRPKSLCLCSSPECTEPSHSQSQQILSQTYIRKEFPQREQTFCYFIRKTIRIRYRINSQRLIRSLFPGKTKGRQLKGKIVSEFSHFFAIVHIFQKFSPRTFLFKTKGFSLRRTKEKKRQ